MKGDFSRQTFDTNKRYSGVLMQQGRVLLDAEWNEQQEIHQHRAQTGARDAIGASGTPIGEDGKATGFEITPKNGKLCIGEGHIYVDGILCVNEKEASYDGDPDDEGQPHPPHPDDLAEWRASESAESEDGALKLGLVYLDVWERHVTHLDDGRIREVALGGPDTTTRKQTVWQVKVMGLVPEKNDVEPLATYAELRAKSKLNKSEMQKLNEIAPRAAEILGGLCKKGEETLDEMEEPPTGKLNARAEEQKGTTGRCQIPPGGGYERLENQLYRVEVHKSGQSRADARFKWSRDNGCVVTSIVESVNVNEKEITVKDTGRDEFLSFANGQWVEIVDDQTELQGQYRQLLQIDKPVDPARRVITVKQTPPAIDPKLHPKLRRWDQKDGADQDGVKLKDDWTELEYGVEVKLSGDEFRAGDYWLIPARTATGDIEWPPKDDGETPEEQSPHGVRHGFCALAIVAAVPQEGSEKVQLSVLHDCRKLFPPLTQLTSFFYLGGDGQEAMPGDELLEPLRVGVANGQWPVQGARVRFEILGSNGTLKSEDRTITGENNGKSLTVLTDEDGVAACRWTLDKDTKKQGQRVRATLLDVEDDTEDGTLHLPIHFLANLSVAWEVAYEPGDCAGLSGADTVQKALERLSDLSSLHYVSGDGQEVMPTDGDKLQPLRVLVANECGPVEKATVEFAIVEGGGKLYRIAEDGERLDESEDPLEIGTDKEGVAKCGWILGTDPKQPTTQRVTATLKEAADNPIHEPLTVHFVANLSVAEQVAYDPSNCNNLKGAGTVQAAIDALCLNSALYYVGGDGQEALPGQPLPKPLQVRVANGRWPVQRARVRFQASGGTLRAENESGTTVTPQTDSNGVAQCTWQPDATTQSQQVEASLLDTSNNPVPPPVRFTANLSVASRVSYDPANCELLAETKTVQEAIDQLCRRSGDTQEPGFHVKEVRRISDDEPVRNGAEMWTNQWLEGLRIVFDREVEPQTVNQFTCFVTLDMPWPVTEDEREYFGMPGTNPSQGMAQIVGFQPLILRSDLRVEGTEILWRPGRVEGRFFDLLLLWGNSGIMGLPAHLTLKGNFIRAKGDPDVYLDGDTFDDPRDEFGIRRPTGDGRRGGDFEMYVWLMTSFIS